MRISVLIATFNREALLDECLHHLGRQRFENGDEVVVVDNGSTDRTPDVIARHARTFPVPLRRIHEPRPGKSIAIARGLDAAAGDGFAFTDDDVNVDERWLHELRTAMTPGVALVGGRVLPRWERRPPRWLVAGTDRGRLAAPLALADYGPQPIEFGPRTAMGGNMAVRREVIEQLGGFAENLGSVRGTLLTGEDHEFSMRVQSAGHRAIYQPSAVVYHWVPAARTRLRFLLRWFFWSGIANATIDRAVLPRQKKLLRVPRYLVKRLAVGIISVPFLALTGRLTAAAERAADVAFAVGYAARCWRPVRPRPTEANQSRRSHHQATSA